MFLGVGEGDGLGDRNMEGISEGSGEEGEVGEVGTGGPGTPCTTGRGEYT